MDASIRLLAIPCGTRDTLFGRSPSACFSEHLCSSGPTCLLIDRARAPMFFVGVTVPPVGVTSDLKGGRSGRQRFDPASGLRSRGRSVSPVSMRSDIDECRATVPALGFASFRVLGHARLRQLCVHVVRARPRFRVTSLRRSDLPIARSACGRYGVPSRSNDHRDELPPG
jgi:hypothetical protein